MVEDRLLEFFPLILMAAVLILLVAMSMTYRLAKLIIGGKVEKVRPRSKTKGPLKDPTVDDLLRRCAGLTQRVAVLEEILTQERTPRDEP